MTRIFSLRVAAIAMAAVPFLASPVLAQTTVVVTPSNPHGWTGTTYGPTYTSPGIDASAGITQSYARSGNGSVEIKLGDAAHNEADWSMDFSSGHSLSSINALSYDWLRSSSSTNDGSIIPAFVLYMSDGSGLVYERAYNASGNAPQDTWTTENILNGKFWSTGNGTGNCANYGAFQTLSYFNTNCYGGNGSVTGLDMFMGYTQAGTFDGAVDNATIGFEGGEATRYNFEADGQSTVPEPSSMALLGTGLVGLVPMIRRRKKR